MRLSTLVKSIWPSAGGAPDQAVLQDADELVRTWGEGAYVVAATMSWREDTGLVYAAEPGHWARVKREIGQRRGWQDEEPEAAFSAGLDRLWTCA